MRLALSLAGIALFAALPAGAEEFTLSSPVTDATVFEIGAEVVRRVPFSVPPGRHRLILQDLPASVDLEYVRVSVDGAQAGPLTLRQQHTPPRDRTPTPEVQAAIDRVEALERQIDGVKDRAATARLAADAAAIRQQFLGDLGKAEGMATAGIDALRALSQMIGDEALDAARAAQSGEIDARRIERALPDLEDQLADAKQALDALTPEQEARAYLAQEISAGAAAEGMLTVSYYTEDAFWQPVYDLRLDRKAGRLAIDRGAYVAQHTGESWRAVNLVLSTAAPADRMQPRDIYPRLRRITDPAADTAEAGVSFAPMAEPVVVAETKAMADLSGYVAVYRYPDPVDVATDADALRLRLDTLDLDATVSARAVPGYGETPAFLSAHVVNTSGEEILPSMQSSLYVDDTFVGSAATEGLAANDKTDLFFGPIKGLLLNRVIAAENEGNSGFISRSNQQAETARLTLRNLTGESWKVLVLDQLPYATQDDLTITWKADPRPDVTDWEDKRGVLAWDVDIAPGEEKRITLEHTLSWPEGKVLE
ncbi:DUF4139 domain-containing protein [Seohaeicola nanhaiensis]|uniref:DUF4139 domain-containing protein n=1 Tax=Seohaeicola nanhaiensis TaxID=1387282 RepID=A0ABV9KMG8_9RHOB